MKATQEELSRINQEGERRFPDQWKAAIEEASRAAVKLDVNRLSLVNRCLFALISFHFLFTFRDFFNGGNQSHLDADLEGIKEIVRLLESQESGPGLIALRKARELQNKFEQRKGGK